MLTRGAAAHPAQPPSGKRPRSRNYYINERRKRKKTYSNYVSDFFNGLESRLNQ